MNPLEKKSVSLAVHRHRQSHFDARDLRNHQLSTELAEPPLFARGRCTRAARRAVATMSALSPISAGANQR